MTDRSVPWLVLPGAPDPPEDFLRVWREAGLPLEPLPIRPRETDEVTGLLLVWVDGHWEESLDFLANLPLPCRFGTVLCGPEAKGHYAVQIQERGGLAFTNWPPPSWLPDVLLASEDRLIGHGEVADEFDDTPRSFESIEALGQWMSISIEATELRIYSRSEPANDLIPIFPSRAAGRASESASAQRIAARAADHMGVVVSPNLSSDEPQIRAGIGCPLRAEAGAGKALGAVVATWDGPFLPSAVELDRVRNVARIAGRFLGNLQADLGGIADREELFRQFTGASVGEVFGERVEEVTGRFVGLVRGLLRRFERATEGRRILVRASPMGETAGEWLGSETLPLPDEAVLERLDGVELDGDAIETVEGWHLKGVRSLVEGVRLGRLAVAYGWGYMHPRFSREIHQLVADLGMALEIARRQIVRDTFSRLAAIHAHQSIMKDTLGAVLEAVCEATLSDGAKVAVVERQPKGIGMRMLRSTATGGFTGLQEMPIHGGLIGWVIANGDWLLIEDGVPPEETGKKRESCRTGSHGTVGIFARPEMEFFEEIVAPDDEKTMLFVPLLPLDGRASGALAIWRNRRSEVHSAPYDEAVDLPLLQGVAPQVIAIVSRELQLETLRKEAEILARVEENLSRATRLSHCYKAVLRGVCELSRTADALLLTIGNSDHVEGSALVFASESYGVESPAATTPSSIGFTARIALDPDSWKDEVRRALVAFLERASGEQAPEIEHIFVIDREPLDQCRVIVLFDRDGSRKLQPVLESEWTKGRIEGFLTSAVAMMDRHIASLSSLSIEEMDLESVEVSQNDPVIEAASRIHAMVDADAVLVYQGLTLEKLKCLRVWPEKIQIEDIQIGLGDLTCQAFLDLETTHIPSVVEDRRSAEPKLDHGRLELLVGQLGWTEAASWLCCPVVHEDRAVGLIKVLSARGGRVLGTDHERIVKRLADHAATELHKENRENRLLDLNAMADRLCTKSGAQLGAAMAHRLANWLDKYLLPGLGVAVVSQSDGFELAFAGKRLPTVVLEQLRALASTPKQLDYNQRLIRWLGDKEKLALDGHRGVEAILHLPTGEISRQRKQLGGKRTEKRNKGHLFFLGKHEKLPRDLEELAKEAASEMALVLHMERLRQEQSRHQALFEHALIGPVQGLTSAARVLAWAASPDDRSPESPFGRLTENPDLIKTSMGRIELEIGFIQAWRASRRYANGEFEVQPLSQPLGPIVRRCFERYRELMKESNITYRLDWGPKTDLMFKFDLEALDLALSNLLENAAKYAFKNREVTLSVRSIPGALQIMVEDIGHGIKEEDARVIYLPGRRANRRDPFRIIPGQGVGLALARAIAKGHGGRLYHTSEALGAEPEGPDEKARREAEAKRPYRVRFFLELPWRSPLK